MLPRVIPAHPAPGAVGARMEAVRRAFAAHDEAARAHAAGNDAELALTGADGALAGEPHLLAEVRLALDIVVVAVDGGARYFEARQVPAHGIEHELHHLLAVGARVVLRPADRLDVV